MALYICVWPKGGVGVKRGMRWLACGSVQLHGSTGDLSPVALLHKGPSHTVARLYRGPSHTVAWLHRGLSHTVAWLHRGPSPKVAWLHRGPIPSCIAPGHLTTQLHSSTGYLATQLHSKIAKKNTQKFQNAQKLPHRYTYFRGSLTSNGPKPCRLVDGPAGPWKGLDAPTVKAAVRDGLGWRYTSAFGLGGGLAGWDGAIHVRLA